MELTGRELLAELYEAAIDAVDGRFCVQRWLRDSSSPKPHHVIAIGKAASAMLQGALDVNNAVKSALVITKQTDVPRGLRRDERIRFVFSSHPVPDASSLEAGRALLDFIAATDSDARLLFLVSGGSSSLVEVCRDGYDLDTLQQVNRHLLASGKDIHGMNAWRKQFSAIKGGGLLDYLGTRDCTQLMISDVQGDDPSVIGSGLLVANAVVPDDDDVLSALCPQPASATAAIEIGTYIIATLQHAKQAAAAAAEQYGLEVVVHDGFLDGDALQTGRELAALLRDAAPGLYIFGGETTVNLPQNPGRGGRNQALALALADAVREQDVCVLCAGTDGIDGNTPCAGALVTGDTATRAEQMGFDITQELEKANSGTVLMATGDLFSPGATQTNVMDIVLAWKRS